MLMQVVQFLARSVSLHDGRLQKDISEKVKKDADSLFKMIGEAYDVLSDTVKVFRYLCFRIEWNLMMVTEQCLPEYHCKKLMLSFHLRAAKNVQSWRRNQAVSFWLVKGSLQRMRDTTSLRPETAWLNTSLKTFAMYPTTFISFLSHSYFPMSLASW